MKSPLFALATLFVCGTAIADHHDEKNTFTSPPFTARVTRNKVRLRHQPNLNCNIIRELNTGELLAVIDEEEDFYTVRPDISDRLYVYNTYISDGKIVGERVNVRLQPDLDSLVVTQLNSGDYAEGEPSPLNKRWTGITVPEGIHYYVAKELIEPIGDIDYISDVRKRERDTTQMLDSAWITCQSELQKPFEEICLDQPLSQLREIATASSDLPSHTERAQDLLSRTQKAYAEKRLSYLLSKVTHSKNKASHRFHSELDTKPIVKKDPISNLETSIADYHSQLEKLEGEIECFDESTKIKPLQFAEGASHWDLIEEKLFSDWSCENPESIMDEFYAQEKGSAQSLHGVLTTYSHPVKNKPGDFLLIDTSSQVPIAFLYSTQIDLSSCIGKEITITGLPRENNNFAFPAYFALSVE